MTCIPMLEKRNFFKIKKKYSDRDNFRRMLCDFPLINTSICIAVSKLHLHFYNSSSALSYTCDLDVSPWKSIRSGICLSFSHYRYTKNTRRKDLLPFLTGILARINYLLKHKYTHTHIHTHTLQHPDSSFVRLTPRRYVLLVDAKQRCRGL